MEYEIYKEGELYHWGIKGMRWGVRRYQNKDGSLTDAGKKHIRAEEAKVREQEKTLKNRQAVKAKLDRIEARKKAVAEGNKELDDANKKKKKPSEDDKKSSKKSVKDMTDEELQKAINRSRLEDQYKQLNPEPAPKQSLMTKLKNDVIMPAAMNSGKRLLENALNKAGDNLLKEKADPNSLDALKKTYDKLNVQNNIEKIKVEMDKRKKGVVEDNLSWDEKLKKQTWEKNERERAEKEAVKSNNQTTATPKTDSPKKQEPITPNSPVKKTSNPAVNAFVNKVQNKPISEVSSARTRKQVQAKLEADDYDFTNWGRYDLDARRWDDD